MIGFQAAGAAPIFHDKVVEKPETVASGDSHWKSGKLGRREARRAGIARRDRHCD